MGFMRCRLFSACSVDFLASYMNEKGKNLATRDDVERITKLQEEIREDDLWKNVVATKELGIRKRCYLMQLAN